MLFVCLLPIAAWLLHLGQSCNLLGLLRDFSLDPVLLLTLSLGFALLQSNQGVTKTYKFIFIILNIIFVCIFTNYTILSVLNKSYVGHYIALPILPSLPTLPSLAGNSERQGDSPTQWLHGMRSSPTPSWHEVLHGHAE